MNSQRLPAKLSALLSVLALFLITQSCSKEDDPSAPGAAEISQNVAAPTPCTLVCLVAGQNMLVGTVGAAMVKGDLLVTYNVTKPGVFLLETHLDVFTDEAQLTAAGKLKNGNAAPGQFAFKRSFSLANQKQEYTVTVTKAQLDAAVGANRNCFFVATHAALSNGETAWGGLCSGGTTLQNSALQFPGRNWGVYFQFCKSACEPRAVSFTYAWEDQNLNGDFNDRDYNDLVIKSSVMRTSSNLRMKFTAVARGASYDHKFRFKIPMQGITGIFGTAGDPPPIHINDGTFYYINVFENTKYQLPGNGLNMFANTVFADACVPFAVKEIELQTNSDFVYSATRPYEPFITVTPYTPFPQFDLYIKEVSPYRTGLDTWTAQNGQVYPNGILIPADWWWPLEGVSIMSPYPTFRSLTQGFNYNWASVPLTPTTAFQAQTNNGGACAN